MQESYTTIPKEYIWKRIHSIFGLCIVLFLIEHLLTNSQSALLFGESGEGFIRAVNFIKNLPYLPALEVLLIGVPIAVHAGLGIRYIFTGKMNSFPSSGKSPSLTKYGRNHAYSLQRITSWILLIGIVAHVGYMRFYRYPTQARLGSQEFYFTRVSVDSGLYTVASRLGVKLYDAQQIEKQRQLFEGRKAIEMKQDSDVYDSALQKVLNQKQSYQQKKDFITALTKKKIDQHQVIAQSPDFGTATLLMVRDSFKSPFKAILYTIFVLAASFHAFNGLWTFCITWGVVIKARSQAKLVNICLVIMVLVALLGLASIWGTYWINLAE